MRLSISAAVVTFAVFAGGVPSLWAQPSLADVARQEEDRRKNVKGAGKVYTNKDLGTVPPAVVSPPADPNKPAAAASAKPAEPAKAEDKGPVKDQAYWSGRMKELRTQLDRDQTYADALQTRVNSLTADFVNLDDPAQRSVVERDRQRAVAELDRLKKAVVDGTKAIADLEEEARRAGVPPGWLR